MASTTTNLALTKPASGEGYSIDVFNQNFQKIDDFAGGVNTNLAKLNTAAAYANNQNLNNYTTTGSYHVGTDTSSSPTGSTIYGVLVVYSAHDTIVQIFIQTNNKIYTRVKASASSNWSSWEKYSVIEETTISPPSGSKWTGGSMKVRKKSGICEIKFEGVVLSTLTTRETIATIPEGFRPATETYFFSSEGGSSFLITTGGELKANSQPSGTKWATGVYISA